MVPMEGVLLKLYSFLLRLYPRQFQQDFAAEMQTVFRDALVATRQGGWWAIIRLCGREVLALPRCLASEHCQSGREKEARMENNIGILSGKGNARPILEETPALRQEELFLAMLPFLLLLLVDALPKLLVEGGLLTRESAGMQVVNILLYILLGGGFLTALVMAWRQKWPDWASTWYLFFLTVPLALASVLVSLLVKQRDNFLMNQGMVISTIIPTLIAVLLYSVARRRPLRGLLAALPVIYLLWMVNNMEFVPDWIEVAIKVPSVVAICLAIAFLLLRRDWCTGLYAVLAMNLVVGLLFSYAGTYHGGTLPFSAPGPNLVEVLRSMVPQYLATGAILIGPLFAWKMRQAGRSGGQAGRVGYHLALGGLLLVILANLLHLEPLMSGQIPRSDPFIRDFPPAAILLGLGVYLIGLFLVYRAAPIARTSTRWAVGWASRLLLAFLPLAIPITFTMIFLTWKWPVSDLYGIPWLWVLPHGLSLSIGMVWLALSVWVVTQGTAVAGPTVSVRETSEAPLLS